MRTTTVISDGIARIRMDGPPINAFSVHNGFVRELTEAAGTALANGHVMALMVHGGGAIFCGRAEIVDFGDPREVRRINILLDMIEQSDEPVVMAIHGTALDGGLELAMTGHYCLCTPEPRLGPARHHLRSASDGREAYDIDLVDRRGTGNLVSADCG
ncbi:MAG: hypothetical protein JWR80_2819 [Bradyrhizobium sp.]|nr:hypothetical protein [Bradyrhizobium sp.]